MKHTSRLAVGLCLAVASLTAHAQLQLSCPIRWDQIPKLDGDPDEILLGVKVRDWKSEYFDTMLQKQEECFEKDRWPESLRKAERQSTQSFASRRNEYLTRRDDNVRKKEKRSAMAQAAENARKNGVDISLYESTGDPQPIFLSHFAESAGGSRQWECKNLGATKTGWLTNDSIKKLAYYTNVCLSGGLINHEAATSVKVDLEELIRFYRQIPEFAKRVDAIAGRGEVASAAALAELDVAYKQLLTPVQRISFEWAYHPQLRAAEEKLEDLRARADKKACTDEYVRAKFPPAWKAYYYLAEQNRPMLFIDFVCQAKKNGAQIRYVSGGLISKEGFEVKGKTRTVQVFTEAQRIPGEGTAVQILMPESAKVDGKAVKITQSNFRAFTGELITAVRNE